MALRRKVTHEIIRPGTSVVAEESDKPQVWVSINTKVDLDGLDGLVEDLARLHATLSKAEQTACLVCGQRFRFRA